MEIFMDSKEIQSHKNEYKPIHREDFEKKDSAPIDTGPPIPDFYGDTRLVLLPRDPKWVFSYWEFNKDYISKIQAKYGKDAFQRYSTVIRSYDVTDIIFDGTNAHSYSDTEVNIEAKNWYYQIPSSERNYCAEIGMVLDSGEFIALARSNTISVPNGKVSDLCDEEWMVVKEDLEKLIKLSGLDLQGESSKAMINMLRNRVESILSLYSASSPVKKWGGKEIKKRKKKD